MANSLLCQDKSAKHLARTVDCHFECNGRSAEVDTQGPPSLVPGSLAFGARWILGNAVHGNRMGEKSCRTSAQSLAGTLSDTPGRTIVRYPIRRYIWSPAIVAIGRQFPCGPFVGLRRQCASDQESERETGKVNGSGPDKGHNSGGGRHHRKDCREPYPIAERLSQCDQNNESELCFPTKSTTKRQQDQHHDCPSENADDKRWNGKDPQRILGFWNPAAPPTQ